MNGNLGRYFKSFFDLAQHTKGQASVDNTLFFTARTCIPPPSLHYNSASCSSFCCKYKHDIQRCVIFTKRIAVLIAISPGIAIYVSFIMDNELLSTTPTATSIDISLDGLCATTSTHTSSNVSDSDVI
ncbi:hypothetical protein BDW22DRAFT_1037956 [Trametopsis cervina]|nr:hypothetical protein BDW22DRAFT_1037956 [Trametopsis cervina]